MSVFDNMKAASGTGTARGTFPIIKNSANGKMKNLKLFGASTQAANPTPDNPQEIERVVLSSIAAYGKNLFGFEKNAIDKTEELRSLADQRLIFEKIDDNSLKCYFNNGTYSTGFVEIEGIDGTKDYSFSFTVENNTWGFKPRIEKYESRCNPTRLSLSIYAANGMTILSKDQYLILSNIQVEAGTTATDFEPYKGNIANLPEAIEMNGIEELKDYIDYDRGVFVQKFGVIILNGSENWGTYDTGSGKKRLFATGIPAKANVNNNTIPNLLCSHYDVVTPTNTFYDIEGITISTGESPVLYLYDDTFNTSDISLWKAHLAKNPVTVVYELAEPIETPLSPAALLELNKLRTFDSITCVSNDAGAEMEIEYFKNNATGQAMSDIHAGVPRFVLDGTTLHIIV